MNNIHAKQAASYPQPTPAVKPPQDAGAPAPSIPWATSAASQRALQHDMELIKASRQKPAPPPPKEPLASHVKQQYSAPVRAADQLFYAAHRAVEIKYDDKTRVLMQMHEIDVGDVQTSEAYRVELQGKCKRGGAGKVFFGTDPLGRAVAAKQLTTTYNHAAAVQRQAARSQNPLQRPRAIVLFAAARQEVADAQELGQTIYAVMCVNNKFYIIQPRALADVYSMREGLSAAARLGLGRAVLEDAGESLSQLHARHKIHCDVKPDNLLVLASGKIMLSDPGCLTSSGSSKMLGCVPYLPPECINACVMGLHVHTSPARDAWSLGRTFLDLHSPIHPLSIFFAGQAHLPASTWMRRWEAHQAHYNDYLQTLQTDLRQRKLAYLRAPSSTNHDPSKPPAPTLVEGIQGGTLWGDYFAFIKAQDAAGLDLVLRTCLGSRAESRSSLSFVAAAAAALPEQAAHRAAFSQAIATKPESLGANALAMDATIT